MRKPFLKIAILALSLLLCGTHARAQISSILSSSSASATTSSTAAPADRLGRETPRGAVLGFIHAAQEENYTLAVEYFQPPPSRHRPSPEQEQDLAAQLLTILNQKFGPFLDSISRDPEGRLDDGLAPNLEKVGGSRGQSESFSLLLIRIEDEHGVKLWYISRQTLDDVPNVYGSLRYPAVEKDLPKYLVENRLLAMPLWQWLAILLFLPVALFLAWLLALATRFARKYIRRARKLEPLPDEPARRFGPGMLLVAAIIHYNFVYFIGASLLYRQYYSRIIWIFLAIGFYWLITRTTHAVSRRIGQKLAENGRMAERSLVSLTRRVLDVVIFVSIGLVVLSTLGVNVTAALAGLGIGGLAIGLGAQKTFENLIGGIAILTDKALVVGDACRIGDQKGTVEDIGLRSTKLRTEDRTLVSIPNGTVATAVLENYRLRDKILSKQVIRLRYDLAPDHLRYVLGEIRNLLAANSRVEESTARVRFLRFWEYAIEIEIYAYILERNYNEFLAVQEELMLQVLETLDRTGAAIALPSQTTIVKQDAWIDPEKAKVAKAAIEKARDPGVPGMNNPAFSPEPGSSKT